MPIRFGFNASNELRAVYYFSVMCLLGLLHMKFTFMLQESQISVSTFRMPNMTSFPPELYNDIPHDDCRCSVSPVEKCLTDRQLKETRIILLIIFVLQVYLLWEYLSLSGDQIYIFAYAYWTASMFIFFGISVMIHRSNYYYDLTSISLLRMGLLLFILVIRHVMPKD
jgi:hypothetical protein